MEPVPIQEARYDVEAASEKTATEGPQIRETNVDEGVVSEASREGWFARLHAKLHTLATKYGVELRGIERVPSNERTDAGMSKIGTMWLSANMVVASFAIGALAIPVFHLAFIDTILTILFINILGALPVSVFSIFGPKFGLRQMVLSRFFFGYYPAKIIAIFNILACLGWSAVNTIVGAQLLYACSNGLLPGWGGIIVIAAATLIVTVFGYKVVHAYERFAWIPCFVVFLIVLSAFCHSGQFKKTSAQVGKSEAGSVLRFAASVFGFATGWTSYAADYTVYQPVNSSRVSVFLWTFCGLIIPLLFTEMLGATVATAITHNAAYRDAYHASGIGGLLGAVLIPVLGVFGTVCMVVLALSTVANNCPNIYSVALSLQVLSRKTAKVPRYVWVFLGTVVYCAIAIPGYIAFVALLENFMLVIGYWLAIYQGISLTEHFVFRRGFSGYAPETYMEPSELPVGIAGFFAFGFGIMGAVLGMSQVWFHGPIGLLCGRAPYGGDVGFELAFGFCSVSYLFLRYWEKKYFRK